MHGYKAWDCCVYPSSCFSRGSPRILPSRGGLQVIRMCMLGSFRGIFPWKEPLLCIFCYKILHGFVVLDISCIEFNSGRYYKGILHGVGRRLYGNFVYMSWGSHSPYFRRCKSEGPPQVGVPYPSAADRS